MQLRLPLVKASKPEWIKAVLNNFPEFLIDHANCERKASAFAMSLIAKYPNKKEIIPQLIEIALEELEHFRDVYHLIEEKGLQMPHEIQEDQYVKELLKLCRNGREDNFLDRLLIGSVIEARGAERFKILYENINEAELKKFYHELWASEAKHGDVFVKMALQFYTEEIVYKRLQEINEAEGAIVDSLPINGLMH
ncbi:MAG: tRNA-(ms[2]io[6]A)-hydroxylase [Sphingobacteriaceae bacterium]|nr:tRNA-(ms[2]io[6]A)-hydroxylase [Sphingobacteriaceae bacterium]